MAFMTTLNIIGSGMTAQQLRLDVISENVTNMNTTRTERGGAYRRKIVVMQNMAGKNAFRQVLMRAAEKGGSASSSGFENAGGVRITEILEDQSDMPLVYDPSHPDANEVGYIEVPNVTLVKEVADAMAASQAYNADVTAFNTLKQVITKGMEIGR